MSDQERAGIVSEAALPLSCGQASSGAGPERPAPQEQERKL